MGKNVAVFVDVANIFYAAKAAGVDIDYVTLLKSATAGRDFVRAYAYTGLDPDNENQRNFHQFLARHQYKVVSKDIRKYGDGKVKANLDIELVVDLMKTARNLDIAVIVSGDGDFASAIRAVQEMGVRCEVISFRGNTSSDLIEVADLFTDITQIAKVDKSSSQSGRRVANDDEDLSMTEVPEKQSEGTGRGRGRGRYGDRDRDRGRGRGDREEMAAAPRATTSRSTTSRSRSVAAPVGEIVAGGPGRLVALPGEKLSRAAVVAAAAAAGEIEDFVDDVEELEGVEPGTDTTIVEGEGELDGDGRRRRRRRGGRGRGRGRRDGVEGGETAEGAEVPDGDAVATVDAVQDQPDADGELEPEVDEVVVEAPRPARSTRTPRPAPARTSSGELPTPFDDMDALQSAPRGRSSTPFGSVWDRQIGTPTRPAAGLAPLEDEEDLEEPAIPEYLLAERRNQGGQGGRGGSRGGQGGRGGPRGGGNRSAYAAAMDRERYGGARGTTPSRFAEPGRGPRSDAPRSDAPRGGTPQGGRPPRFDRPERVDRAPRSGGAEWSEVPPELEQQLLAQLGRHPAASPKPAPKPVPLAAGQVAQTEAVPSAAQTPLAAAPKARGGRRPATAPRATAEAAPVTAPAAEAPLAAAPKARAARKPAAAAGAAPVVAATQVEAPLAAAPKTRAARKPAGAGAAPAAAPAAKARLAAAKVEAPVAAAKPAPVAAAPKARTARKPAAAAAAAPAVAEAAAAKSAEAPKRRTTRKAAAPEG